MIYKADLRILEILHDNSGTIFVSLQPINLYNFTKLAPRCVCTPWSFPKIFKIVFSLRNSEQLLSKHILLIAFTVLKWISASILSQKMKFSIKGLFNKGNQIRSFLRIWSHLLKKSLMTNFTFCVYLSFLNSGYDSSQQN